MFNQVVFSFPVPGKEWELQQLLEERVRALQASGRRATLMRKVLYNSPMFVNATRFDNLEAYEKFRQQNASDPKFRELVSRLSSLSRMPASVRLYQVLVAPKGGGHAGRYYHRATCSPLPGKEREMRTVLEEWVRSYQSQRPQFRLFRALFAEEGPSFVIGDGYQTLTEFENLLDKRPASAYEAVARVEALSRVSMVQDLYEVLVAPS